MEPETPAPPTSAEAFYARTFALVTLFVLGYLLYRILRLFFAPLAWALFIAFLLHPLRAWLVGRLRGRESLAAALLTFATLLMLIGPLTALGATFVAEVTDLLQFAQRMAAEYRPGEPVDLATMPVLGAVLAWLQNAFGVSLTQIQAWVMEGARNLLQVLAPLGGRIFIGALGTVVGFVLMMFMLFFVIRDGHHMLDVFRALIPLSTGQKARLFDHLAAVTRAVFFGSGVTALVQGTLVTVGFAIVGLPTPIVFGVLAALFALVPLAGTPVVWAPAVLVLAVQQRWWAAGFLLAWGLFVATIDNFLRPLLVSGRAPVATLTVFIGVLGGISAFGPIGLFLGPLVLALLIALIRFSLEQRLAQATTLTATTGEPKTERNGH
jgi:predicted PurR-regulated permease PerM